jgi:DNA (cytosine-5)-methyltransferase 1
MTRNGVRARDEGPVTLPQRSFADFFAGIGLMRMGLEREGWRVKFANDISSDKYTMYAAHYSDAAGHYLVADVHQLSPDEVPSVTLATASFPCNDLSLAGARSGLDGPQSSAYWGFIRLLGEMQERRPRLVLVENVAGFLTSRGGRDFQQALLALNELGYAVDPFVIDAARFVPQSRVRLFVVGFRQPGTGAAEVRERLSFYQSEIRPAPLADFILRHPEIAWRLRELPPLPQCAFGLSDIIEALPAGSPFWWDKPRTDYLLSQMSPRHAEVLETMRSGGSWTYGTVFRRVRNGRTMAELRADGIAGCLRTPRGGSGRQILVRAGLGCVDVRLLTPTECARLMGADDFTANLPLNQALFGFGDAVCVPVVAWIARHYLNPLLEEQRPRPVGVGMPAIAGGGIS